MLPSLSVLDWLWSLNLYDFLIDHFDLQYNLLWLGALHRHKNLQTLNASKVKVDDFLEKDILLAKPLRYSFWFYQQFCL